MHENLSQLSADLSRQQRKKARYLLAAAFYRKAFNNPDLPADRRTKYEQAGQDAYLRAVCCQCRIEQLGNAIEGVLHVVFSEPHLSP